MDAYEKENEEREFRSEIISRLDKIIEILESIKKDKAELDISKSITPNIVYE